MQSSGESSRLAALDRYAVLDTYPEARFDRLTRLTANIFGAPIALISLIDQERQWFKSHYGIDDCETPRQYSFCTWAIQQPTVMVVPDATKDVRFADNQLVTGRPGVRFYAGAPLSTPDGERIGTLCIIDTLPRRALRETEKQILTDLAALVIDELELRLAIRQTLQMASASTSTKCVPMVEG